MRRNQLASRRIQAALPAALLLAGCAITAGWSPLGRAGALFEAQPVDPSRFAVLARPLSRSSDWILLVLEQLRPGPLCWQTRPDGLVDPALNRFDYTGTCGRFIDSNAYSLRFAEGDSPAGSSLRLRLEPVGRELQLQASSPEQAGVLVVGRGPLPLRRQQDAFVPIQLEPGWELKRRSYGSQLLNHLYFSHPEAAGQLLARTSELPAAARRNPARRGLPPLPPPPPPLQAETPSPASQAEQGRAQRPSLQARVRAPRPWGSRRQEQTVPQSPAEVLAPAMPMGRVIALQVIPFQE